MRTSYSSYHMAQTAYRELEGIVKRCLICPEKGIDPDTVGYYKSERREKIRFSLSSGIDGDRHSRNKFIDIRDRVQAKHGIYKMSECFNTRQWSAVSSHEIQQIAESMGIPEIPEGYLGENLIISGIPNFTWLPPGTQLCFRAPTKSGKLGEIRSVTLWVTVENAPCVIVGDALQKLYPLQDKVSSSFVKHGSGKRGLVGFVYTSGGIKEGDLVTAYVPSLRCMPIQQTPHS